MNRDLIRNSLFGSGSFVLISVIALLTTPIIVKGLTVGGYGVYLVVTSLVGYYAIADLGLGQAIIKFVAEYSARGDDEGIYRSINSALVVQSAMGLVGSLLLIVSNDWLLNLLRIGDQYRADAHLGVYLCAFGFMASMFGGTFSAVIMGLQRYDISSRVDVGVNGGLNLALAAVAFCGFGLLVAISVSVFMTLTSTTIYFVKVKKLLPFWRAKFVLRFLEVKRMFQFSGYVFVSKVSNLITKYIVQLMISYFLGPAAVVQFAIPTKVTSALGGLLAGGVGVVFPFASQISVTRTPEELRRTFIKGSRVFAALAVPPALFLTVFAKPLLWVWMGADFAQKSWIVLGILSLSSLVGGFTAVPNLMLMGFGKTKLIALFGSFAVVSYGILLPLFTSVFGVQGTAVGMFITTLVNSTLVLFMATRSLKAPLLNYVGTVFRIHILPGTLSLSSFVSQIIFPRWEIYCYVVGGIGLALHVLIVLRSSTLPLRDVAGMLRRRDGAGF